MGIRIMDDGMNERAVMYDSTTDWTLGPVSTGCEGCGMDAVQTLEAFIVYCTDREVADLRKVGRKEMEELWSGFWLQHISYDESRVGFVNR